MKHAEAVEHDGLSAVLVLPIWPSETVKPTSMIPTQHKLQFLGHLLLRTESNRAKLDATMSNAFDTLGFYLRNSMDITLNLNLANNITLFQFFF